MNKAESESHFPDIDDSHTQRCREIQSFHLGPLLSHLFKGCDGVEYETLTRDPY